ncbi:MAG: type 1 glutamine amidotransferase [Chloroflexi bacterium]|nr:type 1 glutamine amidotransferase [Chloroflexota bacterium]
MHPDLGLSLCIINGYPQTSRAKFTRDHVSQAHDNYIRFFTAYVPKAAIDILTIADLDSSLPTGAHLNSYDAYVWTGSDLTIYHDDDPRVRRQIELSGAIYEAGPPQYGSCWGIQMAAVAAGGEVKYNPKGREWGITGTIQQTAAGRQSLLLKDKPEQFKGFIMHLDEVTRVPSGGTVLATDEHTHVQAMVVKHGKGEFWATQYHPEYTLYEMAQLIDARSGPLVKEGFFVSEDDVHAHAAAQRQLYNDPQNAALRQQLGIGDDILDPQILQQELRNWIDFLVIPSLKK